jgi:putative peptidoglycan lipid II flippase
MLDGALRLAMAAAVATGAGLAARAHLLQFLPGMHLGPVLMRATALCALGVGIYVIVARLLGVREIAEIAGMLLNKLRLRRRT